MKRKIFLYFIILSFCSNCHRHLKEFSETEFLMDTICEVKIETADSYLAEKALKEVFSKVEEIDKKFGFSKESEIEKINSLAGIMPYKPSKECFELIRESIRISQKTKGAFDITVGVLSELWGFENFSKKEDFNLPNPKKLTSCLSLVGYDKILIDEKEKSVFLKKKGMRINLGGIAKGYAIKKAKEILEQYGFEKFLINFGGDIYVKNKTKNPWRIAIQHPRDRNKFLTILELYTTSCATSGDYERFFMINNKRYHHIFDPKSGYPKEGIASVTVLCDDPVVADALATGIFVLGEKEGIELAEELRISCIIVSEKHNKLYIHTTKDLKNKNFDL